MMTCCKKDPLTLLSVTSIALAACIWPIICYNFILNCFRLLVLGYTTNFSSSSKQASYQEYDIFGDQLAEMSLTVTIYVAMIISEGILVIGLVIQFMSSFDYLTSDGQRKYEDNWVKCHRKALLLTALIVTVKLTISFFYIGSPSYSSTSTSTLDSILELYSMGANLVFLMIGVNVAIITLSDTSRRQRVRIHEILTPNSNNSSPNDVNLNIESFLETLSPPPPSYDMVSKEQSEEEETRSSALPPPPSPPPVVASSPAS